MVILGNKKPVIKGSSCNYQPAAAAGEEARTQIEVWAAEIKEAAGGRRHPSCCKRFKTFRNLDNNGGMTVPLRCKRFDCPSCFARLRARQMNKLAAAVLLEAPDVATYRTDVAWLLRCPWRKWSAVSKSIKRRDAGAGVGRVRTAGGEVVIVSDVKFPGAEPVTPAVAALALAEAIRSEMAQVRHAARALGRWKAPADRKHWEPVETKATAEQVKQLAEEHGAKTRNLRVCGGLAIAFPSTVAPQTVAAFWARLRAMASEFGHKAKPSYGQTRTRARPADAPDDQTPGGDWWDQYQARAGTALAAAA